MLKFQCNKCDIKKELSKVIMKVINSKVCNIGSECPKCGEYMQEIEKDFGGFPNIKRTDPSLSNKNDKLWKRAKDAIL